MVSRRALLSTLGAGVLAGCLGDDSRGSPTPRPEGTPTVVGATDDETRTTERTPPPQATPEYWPPADWSPEWSLSLERTRVAGVDIDGDVAYVTTSDQSGSDPGATTVSKLEAGSREPAWSVDLPGESVGQSRRGNARPNPRRVRVLSGSLLVVTGNDIGDRWTELTALDRVTGERRWSLRRGRRVHVLGVVDGVVYALAREFEIETTEHHHGTDTPTPEPLAATLLALDLSTGSVRWSREFRGVKAGAVGRGRVLLGVMNTLIALGTDGRRQWRLAADHPTQSVFAVDGGLYYLTRPQWDRLVVRGVTREGRERWRRRLPASRATTARGDLFLGGDIFARVRPDGSDLWRREQYAQWMVFASEADRVYTRTGARADAVGAHALSDGSRAWTFDPPINNAWPEDATADVVVAGGIGEPGQPLYRVDPEDGRATGRYTEREVDGSAVFGDVVLAGTGDYETGAELLAFPV